MTLPETPSQTNELLAGYSIEVIPRMLERIDSLADLLPPGCLVYVAHVDGTPFEDVLRTTRRVHSEGFHAMPHIPARLIPDAQSLMRWVGRYREEAGAIGALVLAGGQARPRGPYVSSMELLESGVFDRFGYQQVHLAAHPEGNRDIDPDGSTVSADLALDWKQQFATRTDARLALVTQFGFDPQVLLNWCVRIAHRGITLPVHAGIAGPARLQTLIKYALACGVGPSLQVLQRRARDLSRLLLPHEPTQYLRELEQARREGRAGSLSQVHVFALGGLPQAACWFNAAMGLEPLARRREAPCPG